MEADSMHSLEAVEGVVLTEPNGDGAVGVVLDLDVGRHPGAWTVMLGPVELDPAGHPWPGQPNQGRLDGRLAVEEVVAIGFVVAHVDAAANLGEDDNPDKIIFE